MSYLHPRKPTDKYSIRGIYILSLLPKINAFSMSQTSRDITGLLMEQVCYDMAMIMMIMLTIWNNSLVEQYNNDSVTR